MTSSHSETMRAPHIATAEVIAYAGQPAAQALYEAFHTLNVQHFDGELGSPLVLLMNAKSARTLGDYCPRDVHGLESRIRIAPSTLAKGGRFVLDVLLHEMVHAWQYEIAEDSEEGYRGHGPLFARRCTEIGADLGLPPVGVKGRDGLPDCKNWPLNVRPAGYYEVDYKAPTRARKQPTEPTEGEPTEEEPTEPAKPKAKRKARKQESAHAALIEQLRTMEAWELCDLAVLVQQELEKREAESAAAELDELEAAE